MRTYGKVTKTKAGRWMVEARPFVLGRLRHTFPGQSIKQGGKLSIAPTEMNARDLLWFSERYPLDFGADVGPEVERLAATHLTKEQSVEAILGGTWVRPPEGQAFALRLPPRPYQQQSADLVLATGSLLNTDALGLGKTCSGIATLTDPAALPCVIVTKPHLLIQWGREVAKFAPDLKTKILKGRTPHSLYREGRKTSSRAPDVVIISYSCLAAWAETLAAWARSIIFDEAHELRRPQSAKYGGAKTIATACSYRSGYSATPIMNYADEILAIYGILAPGVLGSREEFMAQWGGAEGKIADPAGLGQWLRDEGLMIGRTRKDVGRELPPVNRVPLAVEADPLSLAGIEGQAGELARAVLEGIGLTTQEKLQAGQQMLSLIRQATGIAKAPAVAEHVRDMLEDGEKVILTGWHRSVYDIWAEVLGEYRPAFYTGSESGKAKDESRRRFIEGDTSLMVMSNRSGEGLNGLQDVCRVVVFGELDWSPGTHDQIIGRLERDGQTEPIFAYYMVADVGSDPILADILGAKKADADGFMGSAGEGLGSSGGVSQAVIEDLARSFLAGMKPSATREATTRPARMTAAPRVRVADETHTPVQLGLMAGLRG